MIDSPIIMEEVTDPAVIARARAQDERFKRNSDWLQAHWSDLLPRVRGKHLAVAGEEAFIADRPKRPGPVAGPRTPTMTALLASMFSLTCGHEYMRIVGEWLMRDDGATRPSLGQRLRPLTGPWNATYSWSIPAPTVQSSVRDSCGNWAFP